MSPQERSYLHGTDAREQDRLTRLNRLLNVRSLAALDLRGGEKVLEVGSGLGHFARAMARAAGRTGRVVAVERSQAQRDAAVHHAREAAEEDTVETRGGDAHALPLRADEWGTFDVAHARFLLEHVSDPLAVVTEMVRAVRPGGRVVLEDDDHDVMRLWPVPCWFSELWAAYVGAFQALGSNPYVGRELVALLRGAGARPTGNSWLFFGGCSGAEGFELFVENIADLVQGAREVIVGKGLLEPSTLDRGLAELRAWARRDDAALWYGVAWAEGKKPA